MRLDENLTDIESPLTRSIISELEKLVVSIGEDVAERNKLRRYVRQVVNALYENDLDALNRLLARPSGEALIRLYPQAKFTTDKLRMDIARKTEERLTQLYGRLQTYCGTHSITLQGKPPSFVVEHLVHIVFDPDRGTAKVGTTFLRTLSWDTIAKTIAAQLQRVWDRPFDAGAFRDEILDISEQVSRAKPSPSNWVRLNDVYQLLKERIQDRNPNWKKGGRLVPYYKDEFSADISKLWGAQASGELGQPHIELSGIRDPRLAYRVVLPDGQTASFGFVRRKGGGS